MTLIAYLAGVDRAHKIGLGDAGLTQHADGTVGVAGIVFDDLLGTLNVRGWMEVLIIEDACTEAPILFRGWILDRVYSRGGPSTQYSDGKRRYINCNVTDGNEALAIRLIVNPDGKRDPETDAHRIDWILGSGAGGLNGLVADLGLVDRDTPRPFEDADYRDQFSQDVMNDLAGPLGRTFFVYVDAQTGDFGLLYDFPTVTVGMSPISISNVIADRSSTCFYPFLDAELNRDPSAVISLVRFRYRNGVLLEGNTDTYDAFFSAAATGGLDLLNRGVSVENTRVGTEDTARIMAQGLLAKGSVEEDTITVTIQVPASQVGLIRAGQLIPVRFSHLDTEGFGEFFNMRITTCTLRQVITNGQYLVTLTLNNSGVTGPGGGGAPGPGGFPQPPVGPPTIVQKKFGLILTSPPHSGALEMDNPPTEGNWLVAAFASRGSDFTPDAAWTEHPHGGIGPGADFGHMLYREVGPGESEFVNIGGGTRGEIWEVSGIDGVVDASSWADQTVGVQPATINADVDSGPLTPTSGAPAILFLLLMMHNSDWGGNGPTTMTTPTGWTTDGEYEVTVNGDAHPNVQADSQIVTSTTGSYGTSSTIAGAGFNFGGWGGLALAFLGSATSNPPVPTQDTGWVIPTLVADGEPYTWQMPFPFADGTLEIRLDGNAQTWTSYDGSCGQFTVPFQVLPGERFEARADGR